MPPPLKISFLLYPPNWSAHFSTVTYAMGIVSSRDEMMQRAQIWLDEMWAERYNREITLPWSPSAWEGFGELAR